MENNSKTLKESSKGPAKFRVFERIVLIVALLLTHHMVFAQSSKLTGTILDDEGITVPGANIIVKGTSIGTVTDVNGNFSLEVPEGEETIIVSFIGYVNQEVQLKGRTKLVVVLLPDTKVIEDVVVVGFGSQKKESVVGSISTIKPAELQVPTSSITPMLLGKVAGIVGVQRSGAPGEDESNFFIRGVSTFGNSMASPLVLIDGFEASMQELNNLDPENIESFSILKDATATALYGASGANGVILVESKKGLDGDLKFSLNAETKFSMPTRMPDNVNTETYMRLYNEAQTNRDPYAIPRFSEDYISKTLQGDQPLLYPDIDWLNSLTKDVTNNTKVNLNIRGGNKKTKYYVSASWFQDNGTFKNDSSSPFGSNIKINRFNFLSNITMDLTKSTTFGLLFSGVFDSYNGPVDNPNNLYRVARYTSPVAFVDRFPNNLEYPSIPYGNTLAAAGGGGLMVNPYAELTKGYRDEYNMDIKTTATIDQKLNFITKGLTAKLMATFKNDNTTNAVREIDPYYYTAVPGADGQPAIEQVYEGRSYLAYNAGYRGGSGKYYLQTSLLWERNYDKTHDVSALIVHKMEERVNSYPSDLILSLPFRKMGFAGRVTYGYKSKYLIEGNFGYSGSENFKKGKRFAFFPSIAGGYYLSNEEFMESLKPTLSKLKFKVSYGLVGNDRLTDASGQAIRFPYIDEVNPAGSSFVFGENFDTSISGPNVARYGNSVITWEEATKTNFGVEMGFFNKMNVQVDYYINRREDILMQRTTTPSEIGLGSAVPWANLGIVKNKGVDVVWDYSQSITPEFWMSTRGTFTYYKNTVIENDEPDYPYEHLKQEGKILGQYRGYVAERLFIDQADINASAAQFGTVRPGDIKYLDITGDGVIDDNDLVFMGNPKTPQILFGFGLSSGYKKWDLSLFFQGVGKTSIMMGGFWPFDMGDTSGNEQRNVLTFVERDRWTKQNPDPYARFPRLSDQKSNNNNQPSTYWLRDGSYLRLQTAEIGYNINTKKIQKSNIESLRFYLSGINLLTLSPFKDWDPAMGGAQGGNAMGYPIQKVMALGMQMKF